MREAHTHTHTTKLLERSFIKSSAIVSHFRTQSAMEYLTTYGWAILIIAVVLGTLFQLGVFNSANLAPRAPPGSCRVLRTAGSVNLVGVCSGQLPQYVAQFDGVSSYVSTANAGNILNLGNGNVGTLAVWENAQSWVSNSNYVSIAGARSAQGWAAGPYHISSWGSQLHFVISMDGFTTFQRVDVTPPTTNAWHQLIMTWSGLNGGYLTAYIDGVSVGSVAQTVNAIYIPGNPMWIGRSGYSFSGSIANIQIYNTSLDANQIQTLYKEGIGGAPVAPANVVGWWPLNGDTNDYSGNNNNGAPTNIVYTSSWLNGYAGH